jgi:hypothetical protein
MSQITRKLLLAVLTVVVTVVTLGTTTFAWFTLTNTSVIQSFDAQVIGDSGIELALSSFSTDPELLNWRTTLTTAEILAYIETRFGADFRLDAVTTPDGVNFYAVGIGAPGASTTSGYIELPIHFRSANVSEIKWSQVVLTSGVASWRTPIAFTDSLNVVRTANSFLNVDAADAMRISVTGNIATVPTTIAYENPAEATNTVLGGLLNQDLTTAVGANSFYFNSTATYPGGIMTVSTIDTYTALGAGVKVLDLTAGNALIPGIDLEYYGRITIRIWFEGWDAEAYNSLLNRVVSTRFTFAKV